MTKQFMTLAATSAMVLAFSSQMFAQVDEELVIAATTTAGTATATIELLANSTLEYSCVATGTASCGDFTPSQSTGGTVLVGADGGIISDNGQDKTLSVTSATLNGYSVSDVAKGWANSTAPTLQTFNQVDAEGGVGTVSAEFTDINYNTPGTLLSTEFNAADSNVTDTQIQTSTVQFTVLSDGTNAVPAADSLYTNTLTGHANSNGLNGADFANPNVTGSVSISSDTVLNFIGGTGAIQANLTVANVAVPEPAGIVLLGTMVLGLTGLIRKKQVKRS
jgi:hypothetical protein